MAHVQTAARRGRDLIIRANRDDGGGHGERDWFLQGVTFTKRMQNFLGSPDFDERNAHPWSSQPWLTPVIGSGPVGLSADFVRISDLVPAALVAAASRQIEPGGPWEMLVSRGSDIRTWLFDYSSALVAERAKNENALMPHDAQEVRPTVDEISRKIPSVALTLFVLAAQATRTLHRMRLDMTQPINRWGTPTAKVTEGPRLVDLNDEYLVPLTMLCGAAARELEKAPAATEQADVTLNVTFVALRELVSTIERNAKEHSPRLEALHVEQLTEAAWQILEASIVTSSYPGWTSLLLRLVLRDHRHMELGHTRPRWQEMAQLGVDVRRIIEPVSRQAWALGNDSADQRENAAFYDAVARTLWAQSVIRQGLKKSTANPASIPGRAVAYVTSFDYELEMALWRTGPEFGTSEFTLIIPVYAVPRRTSSVGNFLWLEATISAAPKEWLQSGNRTNADFNAMLTVTRWRVLNNQTDRENVTLSVEEDAPASRPTVMRLVGCPLLDLPEIDDDLAKQLQKIGIQSAVGFVHSVTLDEYLALRQTERDWLWSADGRDNPGLPTTYFKSGQLAPSRYWAIIGVPLRDPAIRLRVLSVLAREAETKDRNGAAAQGPKPSLSTPAQVDRAELDRSEVDEGAFATDSGEGSAELRHPGIAVNTRSLDEETMLLNYLGFSVVLSRAESFTRDINDHAKWLMECDGSVASQMGGER
jgi:hypothetical protein